MWTTWRRTGHSGSDPPRNWVSGGRAGSSGGPTSWSVGHKHRCQHGPSATARIGLSWSLRVPVLRPSAFTLSSSADCDAESLMREAEEEKEEAGEVKQKNWPPRHRFSSQLITTQAASRKLWLSFLSGLFFFFSLRVTPILHLYRSTVSC